MRIVALSDLHGFLLPDIPAVRHGDRGWVCPNRVGPFPAMPVPIRGGLVRSEGPTLAGGCARHAKASHLGESRLLRTGLQRSRGFTAAGAPDGPSDPVDEGTTVPCADGPGGHVSVWAAIPEGTDILMSHQAPFGCGHGIFNLNSGRVEPIGSRELLAAIEQVRPRLMICRLIHEGFGRYEHRGNPIDSASVVDEAYRLVNAPTAIDLLDL